MIKLGNSAINRIQQLLEFDISKLQKEMDTFEDTAVERANAFMTTGKYDLAPVTRDAIKSQLEVSRNTLKQISDEVNKATFVFGLSSKQDDVEKEEIKGLRI